VWAYASRIYTATQNSPTFDTVSRELTLSPTCEWEVAERPSDRHSRQAGLTHEYNTALQGHIHVLGSLVEAQMRDIAVFQTDITWNRMLRRHSSSSKQSNTWLYLIFKPPIRLNLSYITANQKTVIPRHLSLTSGRRLRRCRGRGRRSVPVQEGVVTEVKDRASAQFSLIAREAPVVSGVDCDPLNAVVSQKNTCYKERLTKSFWTKLSRVRLVLPNILSWWNSWSEEPFLNFMLTSCWPCEFCDNSKATTEA